MSILLSSKNIFLTTTPSGGLTTDGIDDGINTFRATLSSVPLQTQNGEYGKISLVDFTMYRNFYYVNGRNNHVFYRVVETDGTVTDGDFTLVKGDFNFTDLQANFSNRLKIALNAEDNISGVTVENIDNDVAENRKLSIKLTFPNNVIQSMSVQCRNYNNNGVEGNPLNTTDFFNDSYALLGAQRTPTDDENFETASGFSINVTNEGGTVAIKSFYPMQTGTMPDIYLRCQEVVDNLESETFKINGDGGDSSNIVGSTILGVIPVKPISDVTNEMVRYRGDTSTPYFIMSDNRNISELFFRITDAHGRSIVPIKHPDYPELGNFFCQLTINFSVFTKGIGLPVNNNIENNGNRNAMILKGGVN